MFKFLFNNKKKKDKIITAKVDEHTDLDFTKKVSKEGTNKNKVMNELIKMYNNSEINFLNFNIENENINFSFETQTNIIYHRDMGFLNKIFIDKMLNTKKRNLIIDYCNDLNLEEYANKNKYTIIDMSKIQINILDFKEVSVRDIYNAIKNNDKEFTSNSFFMERGLILLESLIENLKIHQSIYKNTNFYFEEIFEYIDDFEQLITLYKEFDNENKKNNHNIYEIKELENYILTFTNNRQFKELEDTNIMKNAQTQHLYIRHAIIHVFYERIKQIFGQQDEVSVGISQKIKENNTLIKIDRNKMVFENSFEIQYIADIISTELLVNELKSNPIKNKYQITLNGYTNHLREGSLIAQGRALYTNFNIIRNNIVNHDENDIGRDRLIANIPTKIFTKKIIQTVRDLEEFPIPMSISDKQNFIKILDNLQDDESIIYDCIKNNISLMKTI